MKTCIILAIIALAPAIASAQQTASTAVQRAPQRLDFPREIGAPAPHDDGSVAIHIRRLPLEDMQHLTVPGCTPGRGQLTVGCTRHLSASVCVIYVPIEVDEIDALFIEVHERRHCLGQHHVDVEGPDGERMLRWLP